MKKNYLILITVTLLISLNFTIKAQNWTVGVPVDMSFSYLNRFAFGCVPQPDFSMNVVCNNVAGIQYMVIVDSVQDIAVIPNSSDTLEQGDTLFLSQGNNNYSVSFVNGTGNINLNFKAVGTPTTVGQNHPCAFNDMWMSNLLLCNEGLTLNVQNNCTVDAATNLNRNVISNTNIIFPTANNQYQLQLNGLAQTNSLNLFDVTGKTINVLFQSNNSTITIPCQELNAGIYFISFMQNGNKSTSKFVITK